MSEKPTPLDEAQVDQINASIRYAMYSVFKVADPLSEMSASRGRAAREITKILATQAKKNDLVVRGIFDVTAFRADADILIWWHAPTVEALQDAYSAVRKSVLGEVLEPVWSQIGLHRQAEFNKTHVPAFLSGTDQLKYVCVYPFVRSYDWYVLPEEKRRELLREHGALARPYPDVRANTIAAFALGDYEWLLAFEADELHRIVDLMRDLRASETRLHVRDELPFFTGVRREIGDLLERLP